ncbi:SMI1/KNR4 family protein [Myroides injenensis]|uniref:SMI1/KNR4 family protein n=1 Tax=Myroides injenensis TaxID=1183151 RepID=UPI0002892AB9|nr:SMI1/KNR4 family protein [Myroides injenensis]
MESYSRLKFLVDYGLNLFNDEEAKKLFHLYQFSEECYRFLLLQSTVEVKEDEENNCFKFLNFSSNEDEFDIIEFNEDSIFSPYVFFFASNGGGKYYGEILSGGHKGRIICIDLNQYSDIDSLEELLEDIYLDNSIDSLDQEYIIDLLLQIDVQNFTLQSVSFESFVNLVFKNYDTQTAIYH